MSRSEHYDWLEEDPAYAQAWPRAQEAYCDYLRSLVRRRLGRSDILLMFEVKKHMPEYRERYGMDLTGTVRVGLEEDLSQLSREELTQYRALALKAQRPQKALPA